MTYRWSILAAAAIILGGSAWYFGRPTTPKEEPVPADYGLGPRAQIETPHEPPPKVIEVIDLARAYEPVHEPERPAMGVDPASFIEERKAPGRIPMAKVFEQDEYRDVLIHVYEADTGSFLPGVGVNLYRAEKLDVMPREVPGNDYEFFLMRANRFPVEDELIFIPAGEPQSPVRLAVMPREMSESKPVRLDVMPREVEPFLLGAGINSGP